MTTYDRPRFLVAITALVYLFLFAPIAVVVLFSFNGARSLQVLDGLSTRWYEDFWHDDSLRESSVMETLLLLGEFFTGEVPLSGLLTSPASYLNGRLAQHYGVPGVAGDQFMRVDLSATTRRGLLTHAS